MPNPESPRCRDASGGATSTTGLDCYDSKSARFTSRLLCKTRTIRLEKFGISPVLDPFRPQSARRCIAPYRFDAPPRSFAARVRVCVRRFQTGANLHGPPLAPSQPVLRSLAGNEWIEMFTQADAGIFCHDDHLAVPINTKHIQIATQVHRDAIQQEEWPCANPQRSMPTSRRNRPKRGRRSKRCGPASGATAPPT